MKKALFLDRDGVVNKEIGHLFQKKDFVFLDGIFEVCARFQNKGFLIIIVTNQAGIAKGLYTEADYRSLTNWMTGKFNKKSVKIDAVFHCPHHPEYSSKCNCRKPLPGMFLSAQEELGISLKESIMVGDKNTDIEAAISAGVGKNFLVRTGHSILSNPYCVPILANITELLIELDDL
jgi:D-glycero-D-manno-heptose 1,7-bisphosphate phosphatase